MHESSYNEMKSVMYRYLHVYADRELVVVDVGSQAMGGQKSYRSLLADKWKYIGVDIVAGPNVDMVMPNPCSIPRDSDSVNVILCGQTLAHARRPWLLVKEMARCLDRGGHLFCACPAYQHLHRFPEDCWRIYPDGMHVLLEDAGFDVRETYTNPCDGLLVSNYGRAQIVDCWGIGVKK